MGQSREKCLLTPIGMMKSLQGARTERAEESVMAKAYFVLLHILRQGHRGNRATTPPWNACGHCKKALDKCHAPDEDRAGRGGIGVRRSGIVSPESVSYLGGGGEKPLGSDHRCVQPPPRALMAKPSQRQAGLAQGFPAATACPRAGSTSHAHQSQGRRIAPPSGLSADHCSKATAKRDGRAGAPRPHLSKGRNPHAGGRGIRHSHQSHRPSLACYRPEHYTRVLLLPRVTPSGSPRRTRPADGGAPQESSDRTSARQPYP